MSANHPKRARQPNFTKEEVAILVDTRRTGGPLKVDERGLGQHHGNIIRCLGYRSNAHRGSKEMVGRQERHQGTNQATTGGGPEDVPPLDEFETRVAMDPEAIAGISGGLEVGAPSADEQPDNPFIAELSIPGRSHMAYEELGEAVQVKPARRRQCNW
ncbi:hypothetical protein MRX96_016026 [Rhipicephalus microplus]